MEEFLQGPEFSLMAMVNGEQVVPLSVAQDHKRAYDGDKGPNTGGMGVYSPVPLVSDDELAVMTDVMKRVVLQLKSDGITYSGCLYGGFMLTKEGPKVLEFNARFGDPETQVVLPRMHADLIDVFLACDQGNLDNTQIKWGEDWAVSVVLASAGYPGKYESGKCITGINTAAEQPGITVYHAGTKLAEDGTILTAGGRVLDVTAVAPTFADARERAYAACELIDFEGKQFRTDIGARAL
jgi:phosphoribosylamine--glycine ligase